MKPEMIMKDNPDANPNPDTNPSPNPNPNPNLNPNLHEARDDRALAEGRLPHKVRVRGKG